MAATAARGNVAGAYHLQVAFRDDDGYPMGNDSSPDTVVNGSTVHAYYVGGFDSLTPPTKTLDIAQNKGGQNLISQMILGVADYGTAGFTLSEVNEVLLAYIKNATADVTTMTEWVQTPDNTNQTIYPPMVILFAAKFMNSSDLTEYYMNWIFHNVQVDESGAPGTSQTAGQNPNPSGFTLTPSLSTREGHTGRLFDDSTGMAVEGCADTVTRVRTRWPLALTTYVDDNSTGSFSLGYRPVYDDETGAASNSITKNGATTAVTSVATDTALVTQVAAGTAGDRWVVAYPTKFVAI